MLLEKTYALSSHKVFQYSTHDVFVSQIRVILKWQLASIEESFKALLQRTKVTAICTTETFS